MLEQGGLAYGTSSRFHGLLHSGARYAVNDNESAKECISVYFILFFLNKQVFLLNYNTIILKLYYTEIHIINYCI